MHGLLSGEEINKPNMNFSIKDKMNLAKGIAWVAVLFSLIVSVMLIANYLQLQSVDPLESPALETLVEQLHNNPDDEALKEDIRALDLLIRKAYFTSQWQIRTGAYMLIFGALVFILAIRYQKSLHNSLEELDSIEKDPFLDKQVARKWVMISGSGVFLFAILAGILSNNILGDYQPELVTDAEQTNSSIEVIEAQPVQTTTSQQTATTSTTESEVTETTQEEVSSEPEPVVEEETVEEAAPTPRPAPKAVTIEDYRNNFPFFRGPDASGITYKTNVPESFDIATGENIVWNIDLEKPGYSSPIIWDNKLFLTGADPEARMVFCYDTNTGDKLWDATADNIPGSPATVPQTTEDTGLAAPTMATNGTAVFAIFATGDLISLDMDGNRRWAKNLGVPDNYYGHSSSLVIFEDKLIVQYDTNSGCKVMAFSTEDGSSVWETERDVEISWSSPMLVNTGERFELILTANPYVISYNPATGEELWQVECLTGEVGPSAAYYDGIVFAANEYAVLSAIKLGDQPEIIWEDDYYLPEASSPLAADGLLIVGTTYGVVACYDAVSGEMYWEQEYNNVIYASPVYADGKVYLMDMDGILHVFKMDKEYQLIAESTTDEHSVCAPVFANGKMFIRTYSKLYCIGE